METNQGMYVRIGEYTQPIEHKTMMGALNPLWDYGNGLRALKGLAPLRMDSWLASQSTVEIVMAIHRKTNTMSHGITKKSGMFYIDGGTPFIKSQRGKGGGTFVHLYLLLDAAGALDADFRLDMYDTFIKSKILENRDSGGDLFKKLNVLLDLYLHSPQATNTHRHIQLAKIIREKCELPAGTEDVATWNATQANSEAQLRRVKMEETLCNLLVLGVVRDWEHLKELVQKL
jgi:hypothetical protein